MTQDKKILKAVHDEVELMLKTHGVCEWTESVEVWGSACGDTFQFTTDGPKENRFGFCPFCGGVLKTTKQPLDTSATNA